MHRYEATVAWTGSTAPGYEHYDRTHVARARPAAAELHLASDPAFRGDPSLLNPEQLLVLAAASCQLLSFLAVAARARIDVVDYHDDATAEMPEGEGPTRITHIALAPRITVRDDGSQSLPARVERLVVLAHRECYIASSLRSEIRVVPTITVAT